MACRALWGVRPSTCATRHTAFQTENYRQNLAQDFAEDFSRGANQAGQQIVRRELNRKPTIDNILPGRMFNVFVHLDMALEPYVETPQVKQAAPVAQRGR